MGERISSWYSAGGDRRGLAGFSYAFLPVLLFGLFSYQLWLHVHSTSATFDEPLHALAGYRYWQCGNFALNAEHPPLLKLLAALPFKSWSLAEPSLPCDAKIHYKLESFIVGAQFLARNGVDSLLTRARLAASLMSLLLAALVFLAAREMFGWPEACVALALLAFEPTVIAHGSLVTTDMAVTATIFAANYALYHYVKRPDIARLLLAGVALGLMLASKHTALLMLPILLLLLIADSFLKGQRKTETLAVGVGRTTLRRCRAFALMCIVAFLVLWGTYGFRYRALPAGSQDTVSLTDIFNMGFDHSMAEAPSGRVVKLLHDSRLLPEAYTFGLADIIASGARPTFLLGKSYPTGQWFYFPVAFTIKSSIALLLLLPLGLLTVKLYRTHAREMLFLLLPAFGYFAISLTSPLNIGIRHLLPVYPFFIVVAAAGSCALARRHRTFFLVLCALLVFHTLAAARTAPSYIAFANDFWGGTNKTYRWLDDSNVEWGQNYKLVREYVEKGSAHDCWLAPLGLGDMLRHYQPCHLIPGAFTLLASDQVSEPTPRVIEGTVFISTSAITPKAGPEYEPILRTQPLTILGGSLLVFRGRYEVPLLEARRNLERVSELIGLKRFDEAVADARQAVELTPNDPRAHLSLGQALAHSTQIEEARLELGEAISLAQSNPAQGESVERQAREALGRLP